MKNKLLLPLIAIIFLSSCANKFSLTKRKYTKGYYFASSGNKGATTKENTHKNLSVNNIPAKKAALPSSATSNAELKETTVATFNKPQVSKTENTIQTKTTQKNVTASAEHKKNVSAKPVIKQVSDKKPFASKAKKGSSDANLIIMIIFSFFPILALIAVYLHDGKSITTNFWIDLILHFVFLYWLFALLVVLDVLDFA